MRSPTEQIQSLIWRTKHTKSKVYQLNCATFVKEDVVQFQVSVDYAIVVEIGDSVHDLIEDAPDFGLFQLQALLLLDVVIEGLALAEFHDQVHVGPGVNDLM